MQVFVALVLWSLARYAERQGRAARFLAGSRTVLMREWARDVAWKQYWRRAKACAPQRREAALRRFEEMLKHNSCTEFSRLAS